MQTKLRRLWFSSYGRKMSTEELEELKSLQATTKQIEIEELVAKEVAEAKGRKKKC